MRSIKESIKAQKSAILAVVVAALAIVFSGSFGLGSYMDKLAFAGYGGNDTQIQNDFNAGYISAEGSNPQSTSKVTFNVDYQVTSDSSSVSIPAGTQMTNSDGGKLDLFELGSDIVTAEVRDEVEGTVAGALQFGIPGLRLIFSQPITITIPVASSYNGTTLNIFYQNEGSDDWNFQTTCVVSNAKCVFQTTHATTFTASSGTIQEIEFDNEDPSVKHKRVSTAYIGEKIKIKAKVKDESGLDKVVLRWRVPGGDWESEKMSKHDSGEYAKYISAQSKETTIYYYIKATDKSDNVEHKGSAEDPFKIKVVKKQAVASYIDTKASYRKTTSVPVAKPSTPTSSSSSQSATTSSSSSSVSSAASGASSSAQLSSAVSSSSSSVSSGAVSGDESTDDGQIEVKVDSGASDADNTSVEGESTENQGGFFNWIGSVFRRVFGR